MNIVEFVGIVLLVSGVGYICYQQGFAAGQSRSQEDEELRNESSKSD